MEYLFKINIIKMPAIIHKLLLLKEEVSTKIITYFAIVINRYVLITF